MVKARTCHEAAVAQRQLQREALENCTRGSKRAKCARVATAMFAEKSDPIIIMITKIP